MSEEDIRMGFDWRTAVPMKEFVETKILFHEQIALERDRRYAEVNLEKEKALKIKEEADKAALGLAREIQTYKDEKANELREQINSERGLYATKTDLTAATEKIEATVKPLSEYVYGDRGNKRGSEQVWGYIVGIAGTALAAVILLLRLSGH